MMYQSETIQLAKINKKKDEIDVIITLSRLVRQTKRGADGVKFGGRV